MAFQMIHMQVAYLLLQKWDWIQYKDAFIVASVAPDSVHMNPDYEVSMKIRTHLFEGCGPWGDTRDYERWMKQILDYYEKNGRNCKNELKKACVTGICVHCLTDYCNDRDIWRTLQKKYVPPMTLQEFREPYYVEARAIDQWLYQNSPNREEICSLFLKGECLELEGLLKKEEIEQQKNYMMKTQYAVEPVDISGFQFLNEKFLWNFIENTAEKIERWLT